MTGPAGYPGSGDRAEDPQEPVHHRRRGRGADVDGVPTQTPCTPEYGRRVQLTAFDILTYDGDDLRKLPLHLARPTGADPPRRSQASSLGQVGRFACPWNKFCQCQNVRHSISNKALKKFNLDTEVGTLLRELCSDTSLAVLRLYRPKPHRSCGPGQARKAGPFSNATAVGEPAVRSSIQAGEAAWQKSLWFLNRRSGVQSSQPAPW